MPTIVPVVEGHGEVPSLRTLVFLILAHANTETPIDVETPIRIPKSRLLREDELERAVQMASYKSGPDGLVIVLIDADDDCAARLGPQLTERVADVTAASVEAVIAVREYEAWLLASAESLAGERGLPDHLEPPDNPESIRDAKGWLTSQMPEQDSYRETVDQPRLTALIDIDAALTARSFRKLYKEITEFAGRSET